MTALIKPLFMLVPLIVIAGIVLLVVMYLKKGSASESNAHFQLNPRFMTPREQELYRLLVKSLPGQVVLAQVAFSQLLTVVGGDSKENFSKKATGKQKVADFVVCAQDFKVLAVIELDDSTHTRERDERKNAVLQEAGVRLIRWRHIPTGAEVQKAVLA